MNSSRRLRHLPLWAILCAAPLPAAAPADPKAAPVETKVGAAKSVVERYRETQATRFKEIEDRLAVLFRHRQGKKPDLTRNPFQAPTAPVVAVAAPPPVPGEPGTKPADTGEAASAAGASLALLQQAAATLKVTGNLESGGQFRVMINSRPYQEGDLVPTLVAGETVYVRVKEISGRSVTLALNDAEMTLKP